MAFYDWNHDGKKDWQDNFIEYNIYKRSTGNNDSLSRHSSSGGSGSTLGSIIAVIIVFIILGWIVNLFTPKCIVDGCDSEQMEGSSYCYYHKNSTWNRYYKSHTNGASSYNNSTSKYNSSSSSSDSYSSSKNTSSYNADSKSSDTSSSAKKSYTSNKDDDMYDASSYSDAEDFYYDNYDDFCDYEEAEEYYDEYGEE